MPKVIADISVSLDGFVTGEGSDQQHGLGDAPELHTWVVQHDAVDSDILERSTAASGAVPMGRRLFDIAPTTRCSPVAQRRAPHLRTPADRDVSVR